MTREELVSFLESRLGLDAEGVGDETELFSSGRLDSFSMIDLILFVEQRTGSRMAPGDVRMDNLDSISRILRYAESANGGTS